MPRLLRPPRLSSIPEAIWTDRSPSFRRRVLAVAAVVALYVLIRFVPVPGVPCELSAVKDCPSDAAAMALAPADSYAFAHLELGPDEDQVETASELAAKFPGFAAISQGILEAAGLDPEIDVRTEVSPWLGDEAAFAIVPGPRDEARDVVLLAVDDEAGAEAFLGQIGGGSAEIRSYRGTEVAIHSPRLASARRDDFLLLGEPAAVRASIDAALKPDASLEDDPAAEAVLGALPDARLADAYVSDEGIARLLRGRSGLAEQLGTFADYAASTGLAAAVIATDAGLRIELHSALDPERVAADPGFFAAFPRFDPRLAGELAPATLAALEIGDLSSTVRSLLEQADAAVPGISVAFDRLNARLARQGAVDLEEGLIPLLRGEAAAALVPGGGRPYVTLAFDDVDEDRVREAVARLQAPLIQALDPIRTGLAPSFSERRVGDVVVRGVRLGPGLELTYAVFDDKLVVSTSPRGVEQAVEGEGSLAGEDSYRTVTPGASDGVSALVFLDLEGLVELAEPIGLGEIVAGFRSDLDRLKALGLTVRSERDSLDTTIFLEIR